MSNDTLSNKQMDAAVGAAEADTHRVIGEMKLQAPAMIRVSVAQDVATAYESACAIKEVGDMDTAFSNAVQMRVVKCTYVWGWTVNTNKA